MADGLGMVEAHERHVQVVGLGNLAEDELAAARRRAGR
jgi:hypothetical protein